jgi:putative transposase
MTGYVINFNRRHKRHGHLFQNRFKSIVCEEEAYLLELTRYIHLNPLRGGIVDEWTQLPEYTWSGHAALIGKVDRDWQETDLILSLFHSNLRKAREAYERFVAEGVGMGRRPDLVGGGLLRSPGGWSQVLSQRRQNRQMASDERILGSGEFVEEVIAQADQQLKETLRLKRRRVESPSLARQVTRSVGVDLDLVLSGSRIAEAVKARKTICQIAIKKFGYSGSEVARLLGTATSSATRLANAPALPDFNYSSYAT